MCTYKSSEDGGGYDNADASATMCSYGYVQTDERPGKGTVTGLTPGSKNGPCAPGKRSSASKTEHS